MSFHHFFIFLRKCSMVKQHMRLSLFNKKFKSVQFIYVAACPSKTGPLLSHFLVNSFMACIRPVEAELILNHDF
jgi:hypothetical protein